MPRKDTQEKSSLVEHVAVDSLIPYARNARTHSFTSKRHLGGRARRNGSQYVQGLIFGNKSQKVASADKASMGHVMMVGAKRYYVGRIVSASEPDWNDVMGRHDYIKAANSASISVSPFGSWLPSRLFSAPGFSRYLSSSAFSATCHGAVYASPALVGDPGWDCGKVIPANSALHKNAIGAWVFITNKTGPKFVPAGCAAKLPVSNMGHRLERYAAVCAGVDDVFFSFASIVMPRNKSHGSSVPDRSFGAASALALALHSIS